MSDKIKKKETEMRAVVAENIVLFRQKRGLSQAELGYLLGVHDSTVSLMENGLRKINLGTLMILSDALGVHPNALLGFKGNPKDIVTAEDLKKELAAVTDLTAEAKRYIRRTIDLWQ
jgi:transcriptional regulator with XRE-family HTH domain